MIMETGQRQGKMWFCSPTKEDDDGGDGGGPLYKKDDESSSPKWHRMRWTNEMVRILIAIVTSIGDDSVVIVESSSVGTKRKPNNGGGGGSGNLQKKGKWKCVSKTMVEKGFHISPQQCEDKFNDLNKRYKRLNDILGRRTYQVVSNHSLLDSMDHVSPNSKLEVRKILNSKHLFYMEMCTYHNGQSTAGTTTTFLLPSPVGLSEEKEGWLKERKLKLAEEKMEIDGEWFKMEKQRFKWMKLRGKKDAVVEKARVDNQRMASENQKLRMELKLKEISNKFKM